MKAALALLSLLVALPAWAQAPDGVNAMLPRIFASSEFAQQRFGPARWIENGTAYTTLERSEAVTDAFDIVRYETATGTRSVFVSARQLVPAGGTGALDIDDYGWSGYRPQKEAMDRLAADRGAEILTLPTGQGLLLRPP